MKWLARILHVLLIPLIASAGVFKLMSGAETIREVYTDPLAPLGYSVGFIYMIGIIEVLAAVGLMAGCWRAAVGFASLGVTFIVLAGAVGSNLIAGLYAEAISPLVGLLVTVAVFLANRYVLKQSRGTAKLASQ
jgi:hypothetical protein